MLLWELYHFANGNYDDFSFVGLIYIRDFVFISVINYIKVKSDHRSKFPI